MYESMNENNCINIRIDNRASFHIDINNVGSAITTNPVIQGPATPDECIICFETCGDLVDGSSLVIPKCGCKYVIHEECFYEWIRKKQGFPVCIACNTNCFIKRELEIQNEEARRIQIENNRIRNIKICYTIGYTITFFIVLCFIIIILSKNN